MVNEMRDFSFQFYADDLFSFLFFFVFKVVSSVGKKCDLSRSSSSSSTVPTVFLEHKKSFFRDYLESLRHK